MRVNFVIRTMKKVVEVVDRLTGSDDVGVVFASGACFTRTGRRRRRRFVAIIVIVIIVVVIVGMSRGVGRGVEVRERRRRDEIASGKRGGFRKSDRSR